MAANQNVVDELIVKLTLDAEQYKKADQLVINLVNKTEVTLRDADKKQTKREKDAQKRAKDSLKGIKDLALGLRSLALTVGALLGVGSAAGLVGAVVALAGMETGLRRAAVSTGLSNRELQAWGSTARRLGADATAGAQAIADLAREQKQFNLTGNAPTIQALARIGVRVGPQSSIVDILSQAQQIYRGASPAQQGQIESGLSASGLSPDLIVAIKSEKDVREAYARSFAESAEENRKALDAVTDGLTALSNAATSIANSIATVLQPYIEQFSQFVSEGAQAVSGFVDRVIAAGGGVDGFMKVLDQESPELANLLRDLKDGLTLLGQTVDVVAYGFQSLYNGVKELFNWIDQKFGALTGGGTHQLRDAVGTVGDAIKWAWGNLVNEARREGPAPVGSLTGDRGGVKLSASSAARLGQTGSTGTNSRAAAPAGSLTGDRGGARLSASSTARLGQTGSTGTNSRTTAPAGTAQEIMSKLVTQYGFSPAQAAAVAASIGGESSFRTNAISPDGGAAGLVQWRGPRRAAFRARFGIDPSQATMDQQLEFLATDPYERRLLNKSFADGGDAQALGVNVSRIYEAHGNVVEDLKRGRSAAQLASQYGGPNGAGVGQQFNIQTVNVQANTPQEFVGGLQRINSTQNYNSAVRN